MSAQALLDDLEREGAIFLVKDGLLDIDMPREIITEKLMGELKSCKPELLIILDRRVDVDYESFWDQTPFTKEMIEEGLSRWLLPFDSLDIARIKTGDLTIEKVRAYLYKWPEKHADKYELLLSTKTKSTEAQENKPDDMLDILLRKGVDEPHDREFIRDCINRLRGSEQEKALNKYGVIWLSASEAEPVEHKKNNAGRRAANLWLDDYINHEPFRDIK